jgi:hypothetical protein
MCALEPQVDVVSAQHRIDLVDEGLTLDPPVKLLPKRVLSDDFSKVAELNFSERTYFLPACGRKWKSSRGGKVSTNDW